MPVPVPLTSSEETIRALEALVDGSRKHTVQVNREELDRLLIDYGILVNRVRQSGLFNVTLPQQARKRIMPR